MNEIKLVNNVIAIVLFLLVSTSALDLDKTKGEHYILEWAVKIPGGQNRADEVAKEHGLLNRGLVSNVLLIL